MVLSREGSCSGCLKCCELFLYQRTGDVLNSRKVFMAACLLPQLTTTPAVVLCLSIYLDSGSSLSLKTVSTETQCKGVHLKSQTVSCPEPARCNHIFEVMAYK